MTRISQQEREQASPQSIATGVPKAKILVANVGRASIENSDIENSDGASVPGMTPSLEAEMETLRLDALHSYHVLDTPSEADYDALARLAARACGAAFATIGFIDETRQWFKARVGWEQEAMSRGALCACILQQSQLIMVPDFAVEARFSTSALATTSVRFYASVPLVTHEGCVLGALSVMHDAPMQLAEEQQQDLWDISRQIMRLLELRRYRGEQGAAAGRASELGAVESHFRAVAESAQDGIVSADSNGNISFVNRQAEAMFGYAASDLLGQSLTLLMPERFREAHRQGFARYMQTRAARVIGSTVELAGRKQNGVEFPIEFSLSSWQSGATLGFTAIIRDISERQRTAEALRASEERFRAFMKYSPLVAFIKDDAGRYVYVNEPWEQRFNLDSATWLGRTDFDLWPAAPAERLREHDALALAQTEPLKIVESLPNPQGELEHWLSFKFPLQDSEGKTFLAGVSIDISEQKRTEQALRDSEARLRFLAENSRDVIYQVKCHADYYDYLSPAIENLTGYTHAEINALGFSHIIERVEGDIKSTVTDTVRQQQIRQRGKYQANYFIRTKAGETRWLEDRSIAWRDESHNLLGWVGALRDITARKQYEEQVENQRNQLEAQRNQLLDVNAKLEELATRDGLTGVKNHRAFQEELEAEFHRAARYKTPLSLLLLDADSFKSYNDEFGHLAGDAILRMIAQVLSDSVRETDLVARYGGEEFVALLPNTDYPWTLTLAERLRVAVESVQWPRRPITVSIGASTYTTQTSNPDILVAEADKALYVSKARGRNRVTHSYELKS